MSDNSSEKVNPNLILPVGTQVVTLVEIRDRQGNALRRSGTVGKIVRAPSDNAHAYTIQFPDGEEVSINRHEIAIRKHLQNVTFDSPEAALIDRQLAEHIVYRCIVGSRAYGLDVDGSDTDRKGIYLPPADLHWSLYGVPEQIEDTSTQECYWELQKFLVLALKANPNVLECLYTPLVEFKTPLVEQLLASREKFLSRLVYQTYNGYVLSQFRKLEQDFRTTGAPRWKHVMHLIRLLLSGVGILQTGVVPVEVHEHRERLMSIRQAQMSWDEINEWRLVLHREFDAAFESTTLPERPDYQWANEFLIRARREACV